MVFQVLGFWWRDGRLSGPPRLLAVAATSALACAALVAFGPWPLAMVNLPGADLSNTWPPSLALVAYGLATCAVAIAAAPALGRLLTRRPRAWRVVVVGNSIAMTVYLWHFTAMAVAGGTWWALGGLSAATAVALAGGLRVVDLAAGNVALTVGGALLVLGVDRALVRRMDRTEPAVPAPAGAIATPAGRPQGDRGRVVQLSGPDSSPASAAFTSAMKAGVRPEVVSPRSMASRRCIEMSATRTSSSSLPAAFTPSSSMM